MKPTDKITAEITLAELAKIYLLEGCCNGGLPSSLYYKAEDIFGIKWFDDFDTFSKKLNLPENIAFWGREDEFLSMFFEQETEQQKRIWELKETIAKAQQQIEELEGEME